MASHDPQRKRVFKILCKSVSGHEVVMFALKSVPKTFVPDPAVQAQSQFGDIRLQVCCCETTYNGSTMMTERHLDCGCCCSCCHNIFHETTGCIQHECLVGCAKCLLSNFCMAFPNQQTGNQFFTTAMYDMYKKAGENAYHAMKGHMDREVCVSLLLLLRLRQCVPFLLILGRRPHRSRPRSMHMLVVVPQTMQIDRFPIVQPHIHVGNSTAPSLTSASLAVIASASGSPAVLLFHYNETNTFVLLTPIMK
jgi:hypothetical protein